MHPSSMKSKQFKILSQEDYNYLIKVAYWQHLVIVGSYIKTFINRNTQATIMDTNERFELFINKRNWLVDFLYVLCVIPHH